jgi:hypothetical protein
LDGKILPRWRFVANCQHLQICQPFSNHHDFLLVVVGWHLLGCTWVAAKTLLCCINRNESSAKREQESASVQKKKIVQLWEWTSVDLSETLGFVGLYWVELSVCIIPPIIYNLLPPWTYPVLGNHVNLLVLCFLCVCFRSSMHNKFFIRFQIRSLAITWMSAQVMKKWSAPKVLFQ